ncbi:MAG: hypothetical protein ACLPKE_14835 [Streptosporangiaceae bacterium]
MNNMKAAMAAVSIAVAGISGLAACGSHPASIMQSQVNSQASAAAKAVTAAKARQAAAVAAAKASQAAAVQAAASKQAEADQSAVAKRAAAVASAVPVPVPAYVPPVQTDPWAVISEYYGNIDSGNYSAAWDLLSPSMQAQDGPYYSWTTGYANTGAQTLTENGESGDTVSANIAAFNTATGDTQYFSGNWTVDNGLITSASVTQTG